MYKTSKAQVRTNGGLSNSFDLQQGTRQGDPLSLSFFVNCIKPLAAQIRTINESEETKNLELCHKLSLYADEVYRLSHI